MFCTTGNGVIGMYSQKKSAKVMWFLVWSLFPAGTRPPAVIKTQLSGGQRAFPTFYPPVSSLTTLLKLNCVTFQGIKVLVPTFDSSIRDPVTQLISLRISHTFVSHRLVFFSDYSLWCLLPPTPCWCSFKHLLPRFCSWFPCRLCVPITVRSDSPAAAAIFPLTYSGKSLHIIS